MSLRAIICDLDGTLADVASHRHLVQKRPGFKRDFHAFHHFATGEAKVITSTRDAVIQARSTHKVILVSGRSDKWRSRTESWLSRADVPYDLLFMRQDGDFRPDTEVKLDIYKDYIEPNYTVDLAYDDRPSVVALWLSLGITTVVVPGWED